MSQQQDFVLLQGTNPATEVVSLLVPTQKNMGRLHHEGHMAKNLCQYQNIYKSDHLLDLLEEQQHALIDWLVT